MKPIFKVGDKVIVKKREGSGRDYKYCFSDPMADMEGQIFTVREIYEDFEHSICRIQDDCALYKLVGDKNDFSWSSGMLMKALTTESEIKAFKTKEKMKNIVYSSLKKQGIKI